MNFLSCQNSRKGSGRTLLKDRMKSFGFAVFSHFEALSSRIDNPILLTYTISKRQIFLSFI